MSFIWPSMLYLTLAVPIFAWVYIRVQMRRQRLAASYGSQGLLNQNSSSPGFRRHVPPLIFLVALTVLIFALARPEAVTSLPRQEGTVILAFDVSGSMAADDMKPTRMDAAKAAALDFVNRQPVSVVVGVIAFSDSGFSVQLPTNDKSAILAAINRLKPERGTSLGQGILASLNIIFASGPPDTNYYSNETPQPTPTPTAVPPGYYNPAAIVLLTDGENNISPDPFAAAQVAADRGVRIYTVGIGSAAGATLDIDGFSIFTQLNEPLLQQISTVTGGEYYNAASAEELKSIYENINPQLVIKPQKTELTSLFAGAGILLLLAGGAFSLLWFGRLP